MLNDRESLYTKRRFSMINDQLLQYIKEEREKGIPADKIAADLVNGGGWNRSDVDEAFHVLNQQYLFPQKKKQLPSVTINIPNTSAPVQPPPVSSTSGVDKEIVSSAQLKSEVVTLSQQSSTKVDAESPSNKASFGLGATILLLLMILISGLLVFFYFRLT